MAGNQVGALSIGEHHLYLRDALELAAMLFEPLHAERQVRPTLVLRQRVDFIDDQPPHAGKMKEPLLLAEQQAKAFGGGEQYFGEFLF